MKKIFNYKIITVLLTAFVFGSCDNGFDELNTNKTSPTYIDPVFLLNSAILNTSYGGGFAGGSVLIYDYGIVQQITTPAEGVTTGANLNRENRGATESLWQKYNRNVIRNTRDVIATLQNQPDRVNLLNMTRIIQAYAFMVLTDTYGEIPYSQGGTGYTNQIFFPVYDSQESIYDDLITELTEATAGLNSTSTAESSCILFNGDVDQWRKFGYSLLLRAGMRLSKVNPTKAETVANTAFQGGVMTLNSDNAAIWHDNNYRNEIGVTLNSSEGANFYLAEPFVTYLQNTNDPRLSSIAVSYPDATSGSGQGPGNNSTTDPDDQIGIPVGQLKDDLNNDYFFYSQVDRTRMAKLTAPAFLVTASQSQLLLAEARERGWITTGTVEEYYINGVTLHMEQMADFDAGSAVDAGDITDYLTNNPFDGGSALEQINTQYWISSFLNGPEAFANFRRSGYPDLPPNPAQNQQIEEDFIRRLLYPTSEIAANSTNVQVAIERMGGDKLDTRVWWDVE